MLLPAPHLLPAQHRETVVGWFHDGCVWVCVAQALHASRKGRVTIVKAEEPLNVLYSGASEPFLRHWHHADGRLWAIKRWSAPAAFAKTAFAC